MPFESDDVFTERSLSRFKRAIEIPEEERCELCSGTGLYPQMSGTTEDRFTPCLSCEGKGRKIKPEE